MIYLSHRDLTHVLFIIVMILAPTYSQHGGFQRHKEVQVPSPKEPSSLPADSSPNNYIFIISEP